MRRYPKLFKEEDKKPIVNSKVKKFVELVFDNSTEGDSVWEFAEILQSFGQPSRKKQLEDAKKEANEEVRNTEDILNSSWGSS